VQELLATTNNTHLSSPLTTYFFFEYNAKDGEPAPRNHAYRAFLSQLFHQFQDDKDILEIFSFALSTKRRHGQPTATTDELLDIMRTLVARIDQWYIVIDAVDECEDADNLLLDLSKALGDRTCKVLLFSRPNVRFLRQKMKPQQVMTINRLHNQEDLRAYFNVHMQRLQDLGIIPPYATIDQLIDYLLMGADGMFQWARLMITHLQSEGLSPRQRLSVITNLTTPENLDDMFIRILDLLSKKLASEQALARRIFVWVAFAKRPLVANQLEDILTPARVNSSHPPGEICQRAEEDSFTNFEHSAVMVSGGLIEKRWSPHSTTAIYTFIHGSVHDFFKSRCDSSAAVYNSRAGSIDYFLPPMLEAEADLTLLCLSYIVQRIPGKPLSGSMFEPASTATLGDLRPFVSYAALYWPHHLLSMETPGRIMNAHQLKSLQHNIRKVVTALGEFLLSRLIPMVWVELKYTFGKQSKEHDTIHNALIKWAQWAQNLDLSELPSDSDEVPSAIAAFAEDLMTLHQLWGDTLLDSPHQIWNDITAFTSSPFFVTTKAVTVKYLIAESSSRSGFSSTSLSKISRDDPNTDLLAVLTIWPSK
jgi:hypothetical protein